MCLYILRDQKKQIATENIPCYKELYSNGKTTARNFRYIVFQKNDKVHLFPRQLYSSSGKMELERGYHSRLINSVQMKTHLFIIPKGSEYYMGRENDTDFEKPSDGYVSNNILYIGRNNFINRLIGKYFYGVIFHPEQRTRVRY